MLVETGSFRSSKEFSGFLGPRIKVETSEIRQTPVCICHIDDAPEFTQMAEIILTSQVKRPELYLSYNDPEEAVQDLQNLLVRKQTNVFVVDYNMPVLNGLDVSEMIRQDPRSGQSAILLCTGNDVQGFPPDGILFQKGVDAIVDKMLLSKPERFMSIARIAAARRRVLHSASYPHAA